MVIEIFQCFLSLKETGYNKNMIPCQPGYDSLNLAEGAANEQCGQMTVCIM